MYEYETDKGVDKVPVGMNEEQMNIAAVQNAEISNYNTSSSTTTTGGLHISQGLPIPTPNPSSASDLKNISSYWRVNQLKFSDSKTLNESELQSIREKFFIILSHLVFAPGNNSVAEHVQSLVGYMSMAPSSKSKREGMSLLLAILSSDVDTSSSPSLSIPSTSPSLSPSTPSSYPSPSSPSPPSHTLSRITSDAILGISSYNLFPSILSLHSDPSHHVRLLTFTVVCKIMLCYVLFPAVISRPNKDSKGLEKDSEKGPTSSEMPINSKKVDTSSASRCGMSGCSCTAFSSSQFDKGLCHCKHGWSVHVQMSALDESAQPSLPSERSNY